MSLRRRSNKCKISSTCKCRIRRYNRYILSSLGTICGHGPPLPDCQGVFGVRAPKSANPLPPVPKTTSVEFARPNASLRVRARDKSLRILSIGAEFGKLFVTNVTNQRASSQRVLRALRSYAMPHPRFTKTKFRGISRNQNHLAVLFASANWLMRARSVALTA